MWKLVFLLVTAVWAGAQGFPGDHLSRFRQVQHLSLPQWDQVLADTAQARAEAMAVEGLMSHNDASGRGVGLQLRSQGYPQGVFGEVLGSGAEPTAVWSAWLASLTHRQVLAEPGWLRWGAGSARVGGTTVWVLRFWKP